MTYHRLRRLLIRSALLLAAFGALPADWAAAQSAANGPMQISWEVRNRFRLFREERDFKLHADTARRVAGKAEQGGEDEHDRQ